MLEEGFQVLCKRGSEALNAQPFCEGGLEGKEASGLAGVKGAVHIGCQEDAEMRWQCELIKGKNVMAVDSGCGWIEKQGL